MGRALRAPALPRARGGPVLGSSLALLRDPLAFLLDAHGELGPIFEVRAATRRFVVLAGREANRFVSREGRDALESWSFWGKLSEHRGCPHAMLAVDGPDHRRQRKLYGDVLSRRLVDAHRAGCAELVRAAFAGPGPFVVRDETRLLVARLVHHCLTGGAAPIDTATARALMEVFRWETNTLLLGKWPRLALRAPSYRRALARAEAFLDELVRLEDEAGAEALGGWFERVREGRRRFPELFGPGDLRFAMLMPFVAGVDTVGSTLGFVIQELLTDPRLRERVSAEVEGAYAAAEGVPELQALAELPALHGLVIECLRLYPAAFAMYRGAARDFEFAGRLVRRGTEVAVLTSATHFDPAHFPDPQRLDVDRHAGARPAYRQKQVFMPYGAGPHVCLGAGMGEALLLLATAAILRDHALRPCGSGGRLPPSFDPSLSVSPRLRVRSSPDGSSRSTPGLQSP